MLQDAHPGRILRKHLEAAAQLHEVSTLQSRGVRKVRVLSESRMQDVARIAVYRAVQAFLAEYDLDPETQAELEARSETEFRSLVTLGFDPTSLDLGSVSLPASAASVAIDEVLARELNRLAELARDDAPEGDAVEAGSGHAAGVPTSDSNGVEDRMARDITRLIERDWKNELAQVENSHRQQLEILEARIAKLVSALESTDRVLAHLQEQRPAAAGSADTGRTAPRARSGPLVEKKSQLLDALFQANVHLQELSDQ